MNQNFGSQQTTSDRSDSPERKFREKNKDQYSPFIGSLDYLRLIFDSDDE